MHERTRAFMDDGYFVVDAALSPSELRLLRDECQRLVAERDEEMTRLGVDVVDLDHRGRRYFVHGFDTSAPLRDFLRAGPLVTLARQALGDTVYLFNEQFVVKAAERGMSFSWHQDSGFIPYEHPRYLTCWTPLDDVSLENGTVSVLPYGRAGTSDVVPHVRDEASHDLVGYVGGDPGDPLVVRAGSVVCFASTLLHRSGPNTTDQPRRVYVVQYSPAPILDEHGRSPRHLAELVSS